MVLNTYRSRKKKKNNQPNKRREVSYMERLQWNGCSCPPKTPVPQLQPPVVSSRMQRGQMCYFTQAGDVPSHNAMYYQRVLKCGYSAKDDYF